MVAITSTVFVVRAVLQAWRRRAVEAQDILLLIAFLVYLAFSILYIVITPIFFKIQALQAGRLAPWPTMMADIRFASKVMWQSGMEYWTCLWFVKFSLLALYKKLLVGMPKVYLWTWWGTLVFCIVVSKDNLGLDPQEFCAARLTLYTDMGNLYYNRSRPSMQRYKKVL